MRTRRSLLKSAATVGALGTAGLAGCLDSLDSGGGGDNDTVEAAYVYDEPVSDLGWTNTHEVVRESLEDELDWYETRVVEDIAPSEAEETFDSLAEDGVDIIEAATFDYGEPAVATIEKFDDIYIETPRLAPVEGYSGWQKGYYLGKLEHACYVVGKAAGMVTETNTLGYVQSFGIPSTITELNALMSGALSVNEDVEMVVRTVNTWFDPPQEQDAAQTLIDAGADVIGYRTSTPAALEVAADEGVWGYGYADDFAGTDVEWDGYISSRAWDWTPFYRETAEYANDGNLDDTSRFNLDEINGNYLGIPGGGVKVGEYGGGVPSDVQQEMDDTVAAMEDEEVTDEDIFSGTQYADWSPFERVSGAGEYIEGINVESE